MSWLDEFFQNLVENPWGAERNLRAEADSTGEHVGNVRAKAIGVMRRGRKGGVPARVQGPPEIPEKASGFEPSAEMSPAPRPFVERSVPMPGIRKGFVQTPPEPPARVGPPLPEGVRTPRRRPVQLVELDKKSLDSIERRTTPRRDFDQMPTHRVPDHLTQQAVASDLSPPWGQRRVINGIISAQTGVLLFTVPPGTVRVVMWSSIAHCGGGLDTDPQARRLDATGAVHDVLWQETRHQRAVYIHPESPMLFPPEWALQLWNDDAATGTVASMIAYYVDLPARDVGVPGPPGA